MTSFRFLLAVTLVSFAATMAFDPTYARGLATAARQASLPEGEGRDVGEQLFRTCHGLGLRAPSRRDVRNWLETVELMKSFGAEATDEQWQTITDYIVASLAVLNANKAASDEFARLLRIDDKTAQGVVAYREQQGGFKTVDDLKKAPGLDAARIDALQDRLIF